MSWLEDPQARASLANPPLFLYCVIKNNKQNIVPQKENENNQ